ncbi:D-2-hydroxyacid dehydrogenase [Nocardiopsis halophila]|uniref:D-2-hydroxyacid dehydrogenase n=1 Tax=Nocardiopsis halophila TaxID=141692 RepID=UPI0003497C89|nr:D-2-hydroxyacid dehydrogenase [Nocardiopsis halophila]
MSTADPSAPALVVLHGGETPPGRERIDHHPGLAEVRYATAEQLPEALPGARVLLVWDLFTEALTDAWDKADALEWVHAATTGVDNLMFPGLVASEAVVTNSRGVFEGPIAETVLGLVLSFAKDLHGSRDLQHAHTWRWRESERIEGRTALVVGTGPIGRAIARLLRAAGLEVTGAGRTPRTGDPDFGTVVGADPAAPGGIAEELGRTDYAVVAAPLTDATRGLFDAGLLARMKPTARLINVARGPIVVEEDLVRALREGTIAGAALDVFATEPLPDSSPLWDLPQAIVLPHMSGDVVGWKDDLVRVFLDNLDRRLRGEELRNVVDKARGYVPHG